MARSMPRSNRDRWIVAAVAMTGLLFTGKASGSDQVPMSSDPNSENWPLLDRMIYSLEEAGVLPGIRPFLMGTAYRESRFNPAAMNASPGEARAAARGYRKALERGYFVGSPWTEADRWGWGSGGWFGFLPSSGLSGGGKRGPWQHSDPMSVLVPAEAVGMAVAYIMGLIRQFAATGLGPAVPHEHRNWLAIRRGWAAPSLVKDYLEAEPRSRAVRARFLKDVALAMSITERDAEELILRPVTVPTPVDLDRLLVALRQVR